MLPSNVSAQVICWTLLLAWLAVCVVYDLRSRLVPAWLTVAPLILTALWRLLQGDWQIVGLVVALVLVSDLPQARWQIPLACVGTILTLSLVETPDHVYAMLVIFAVWALWEIGATGGADAKIIMTLVLLFANGLLFIPIVLVGGFQGFIGSIARRRTIPYTVAITLGTVAWMWITISR